MYVVHLLTVYRLHKLYCNYVNNITPGYYSFMNSSRSQHIAAYAVYFIIHVLESYNWFSVPGTASNVPTPVPVLLFKIFSRLLFRNCYLDNVILSEPEHSEQFWKNNNSAHPYDEGLYLHIKITCQLFFFLQINQLIHQVTWVYSVCSFMRIPVSIDTQASAESHS